MKHKLNTVHQQQISTVNDSVQSHEKASVQQSQNSIISLQQLDFLLYPGVLKHCQKHQNGTRQNSRTISQHFTSYVNTWNIKKIFTFFG